MRRTLAAWGRWSAVIALWAALALLIPIAWISERVNGGSLRAAEWARAKIDELSR